MGGYGCFANVYDELTQNISYKEITEYYDRIIQRFGGIRGIFLDLACGTGNTSIEFSKLGYDVIGVDSSVEMLSVAMSKPHKGITYLCQDMTELDMFGTIDVTVCVLDSINHLANIDQVQKAFNKVSLFTNPNGIFVFDVNTIFKHKNILSNNIFIYETEKVYCVWQNEYIDNSINNRVDIVLDIFESGEDGSYFRYEEDFAEIALSMEDIEKMLIKSGFEVCACFDYMTENYPADESEKLLFVAKKI